MKTVAISEKLLRDLYKDASSPVQLQMERELGRELFDPIYSIKSYEDACIELCLASLSNYDINKRYASKKEVSFHKLSIIAKAINKKSSGGDIDLMYFPKFKVDVSGVFVYAGVATRNKLDSSSGTFFPIFYQNEHAAEYAGKTFTELYEKFLI